MIGGYTQNGLGKEAFEVFCQMIREGYKPDACTFVGILNTCDSPKALDSGKEIHARISTTGLESDVRVNTSLLKMYTKCGSLGDAQGVFDRMLKRNIISWNVIIGGYAESGDGETASELFRQIQRDGLVPTAATYLSILNPSASNVRALKWVKEVHGQARRTRLDVNVRVANALAHMYSKTGSIRGCRSTCMQRLEVLR
jgi:pentatricopeptide repeat protein